MNLGDYMFKRYLIVFIFLAILVGCFFLFFDKPTNKDLYNEYLTKLERKESFDNINDNSELKIVVDNKYINNQYHYVVTFTSKATLNNFKALVIPNNNISEEYYPSFGIIDNKNINLVDSDAKEGETKGVNLVVSNKEEIETFKVFVSYNSYEYYYLIDMGE